VKKQYIQLPDIRGQKIRNTKGQFRKGYTSHFRKYKICQECHEIYFGRNKKYCSTECQSRSFIGKHFSSYIKNGWFYYHYGTKKIKASDIINAYKKFSLRNIREKFHIDCKTVKRLLMLNQIDIKNRGAQTGKNNSVFKAIKNGNWKDPMKNPEIAEKVAQARLGEKNPNWRGGTSGRENYGRAMLKRKGVDLTRCSKCGEKTKRIYVHHLDEDKWNYSLNNLKVVCPKCHSKYHSKKEVVI